MLAAEPTHTLTALTQDDLDALNVLYPPATCNATRVSGPLHIPSASWYAGWTLIGTFVVPLAFLAFLLPPCAALARCLHTACSPVDEGRAKSGRAQLADVPSPTVEVKPSGREYKM